MAGLGGTLDANTVEPNAPMEIIPAGDYRAQITASSMEPTKNGNGRYLKLELEILDGPQAGRKLFDRLNLENPNSQAVEIAQRTLSAICHAIGVLTVSDSEQLHMRPMLVKVKVKPRNDNPGEMSNEIGGYKPCGPVGGQTAQQPPKTGVASSGGGAAASPPWKRPAAA